MTRSELLARVATLLGGRVAEQVVFDEISTGAQNDLERATSIVRQMIMEYGMSDELGPITFGRKHNQIFLGRDLARDRDFSEEVAKSIDKEIRGTVEKAYHMAEDLIVKNRDKLDLLATTLLEQETLNAEEIEALMTGTGQDEAKPEEEPSGQGSPASKEAGRRGILEKKKDIGEKVKVVFRPEKSQIHPKPGEEV